MRKLLLLVFISLAAFPAFSHNCHYDLPGDYNFDCTADLLDVVYLAQGWLIDCNSQPVDPNCIPLDYDGDGYDVLSDCDDDDIASYPGAVELCDGLDNDCDTVIDNGCADTDGDGIADAIDNCPADYNPTQVDLDLDGYGQACDCDDNEPDVNPGELEICDGLDNDCDTKADNGLTPPLCSLQDGVCSGSTKPCGGALGWQECTSPDYPPSYDVTESTCDGLDNDCDGSVDEGDPSTLCPPPANAATTACSGNCVINSCDSGYYDIDGNYDTGCECADDIFAGNNSCNVSVHFGNLADIDDDLVTSPQANIPQLGGTDWYKFTTSDHPFANYNVRIRFVQNSGGSFRFDVYKTSCFTSAEVRTAVDYFDPETPSDDSDTYYIRVYRTVGPVSCNNYRLEISNGVY